MFEKISKQEEKPIVVSLDNILKYRVFATDIVPKPDVVLSINNSMVWTRKNISCSSGKAKGGKTALSKMLVNSILKKGENAIFSSYLPAGKDKILWIDTEQNVYHITIGMQQIAHDLQPQQMDRLMMFTFDTLSKVDAQDYVKTLIYGIEGVALVVLDGISDLIFDSNDLRETDEFIRNMRIWATERDLHIHNLIHENPTESNNKMKGHLGTKLADKSECVFSISTSKEDDELRIVTNPQSRNKKCLPFSFRINSEFIELENETYIAPPTGRKPKKIWQNHERYEVLINAFLGIKKSQGIGYSVLLEKVRENTSGMGENAIKEFVKYAKEMNWVCQDVPKGAYFLHDFIDDGLMV